MRNAFAQSEQPRLSSRLLLEGDEPVKDLVKQLAELHGVGYVTQDEKGKHIPIRVNTGSMTLEAHHKGAWKTVAGASAGAPAPASGFEVMSPAGRLINVPLTLGDDLTVKGDTYLSGLTASRLLATDSAKKLISASTGPSLTYAADTLDTIQDIRTSASPQFAGLTLSGDIAFTNADRTIGWNSADDRKLTITNAGAGKASLEIEHRLFVARSAEALVEYLCMGQTGADASQTNTPTGLYAGLYYAGATPTTVGGFFQTFHESSTLAISASRAVRAYGQFAAYDPTSGSHSYWGAEAYGGENSALGSGLKDNGCSWSFFGISGGCTVRNVAHTDQMRAIGVHGKVGPSATNLTNWIYWAGLFEGDLQVISDAKLILEGSATAKGDSYLTYQAASSDIAVFVDNTKVWTWDNDLLEAEIDLSLKGVLKIDATTLVDSSGYILPISSTDAAAPNSSVYINSVSGKLTFKDSGGVANPLY